MPLHFESIYHVDMPSYRCHVCLLLIMPFNEIIEQYNVKLEAHKIFIAFLL